MNSLKTRPTILVVDDVPAVIREMVNVLRHDYQVIVATSGPGALEIARFQDIDLILLDVVMPEMDGFEVCHRLKKDDLTSEITIIFVTAETSEEEIARGLNLGAYYYLTKPIQPKTIRAVVSSALAARAAFVSLRKKIRESAAVSTLCYEGRFIIKTLDEALSLTVFLANACPHPEKAGVGLKELLFNAVEHGNLGITYEEKSILCKNDQLDEEIDRRLALPENISKCVSILYQRVGEEIIFQITDQGLGFDWKPYLVFNPSRVFHLHGRGIALANTISFDRVEYQGNGNEVIAAVRIRQ
ncbi:MAG TPA: response regulator [Magnetococcales bacterium]|nr:response regulator [Magnetococcales bacterium]